MKAGGDASGGPRRGWVGDINASRCARCDAPLDERSRSDRRTCSTSCRVALWRAKNARRRPNPSHGGVDTAPPRPTGTGPTRRYMDITPSTRPQIHLRQPAGTGSGSAGAGTRSAVEGASSMGFSLLPVLAHIVLAVAARVHGPTGRLGARRPPEAGRPPGVAVRSVRSGSRPRSGTGVQPRFPIDIAVIRVARRRRGHPNRQSS